jgi:hypothetical protein
VDERRRPHVVCSCRCWPACRRSGPLPGRGAPDPSQIWALGLVVTALWLVWSELKVEEVAATPMNKVFAAHCSLAPVISPSPFRYPAGLVGEGSSVGRQVTARSGGSRSFALSARVRGAGGPSAVSFPPSSPLPADTSQTYL